MEKYSTALLARKMFTTKVFRRIITDQVNTEIERLISQIREDLKLSDESTNSSVLKQAYKLLEKEHRSEYLYKNLITSKIFIGRHKASKSALLNEFRIGNSIADLLLLNGTATVYEIKTELDNPNKLRTQINEYFKVAPFVNVIVHDASSSLYEEIVSSTPAGLLKVGPKWSISTVIPAQEYVNNLDIRTMLNTLRVSEMQQVIRALGLEIPVTPNGERFKKYFLLLMKTEPSAFHSAYLKVLKGRSKLNIEKSVYFDYDLYPYRALLLQINPDSQGYENLRRWLEKEV